MGRQTNAVVTIVNDDSQLGFASPSFSVNEGVNSGEAVISIERLGGLSGSASVQYLIGINGSATANVDFIPVSGPPLTFAPVKGSKRSAFRSWKTSSRKVMKLWSSF